MQDNLFENNQDRDGFRYSIIVVLLLLGFVGVLISFFIVVPKLKIWFVSNFKENIHKMYVATLEDPDKDNDGISNMDEINIYGTDPENNDTNNNGVLDGKEIYNVYKDNVLENKSNQLLLYRNNITEKGINSLQDIFERHGIQPYNFYVGLPNELVEEIKKSRNLRKEKKFQESIFLLEGLLKDNSNTWIVNYYLGLSYHGIENFEKALEYYEKLLKDEEALNPLLYQDIAASYYGLGDELKFVEFLNKSIEEFPEDLIAYFKLAQHYADQNNLIIAKEIIDKGLKIEPRYFVFYNFLGNMFDKKGNKNKAFEYYSKSIEVDFHNAIGHMNLSIMYREDFNNPEQSLIEALIADEFDSENSRIKNVLGLAYVANGNQDQAVIEYKKGINLEPTFDKVYNNLGIAYAERKEYSLAEETFKKAIGINAKYANVYNNLGHLYIEQGKYLESIPFLKKASEFKPKGFLPHQNLGFAYLNMGKTNDAIREWEIAISLGMKNEEVAQILKEIKNQF